jgi:hypothetical protein
MDDLNAIAPTFAARFRLEGVAYSGTSASISPLS